MAYQTAYKTMKDVPRVEHFAPGSPLCPGCGAQLLVRLALKALGPKTIVVNVPGCLALFALFPFASMKMPFLFTPFACAPAAAQGVRDALSILARRGKPASEDHKILVLTGDGAAYDIGFQSASAAIHRQLDFHYLCYDNEAYGNTGFQFSSATPYASRTSTTEATESRPGNLLPKKNLFEIWRAHRPPYLATVAASRPVDLWRKFEKASALQGPKLFIGLAVCPTGWGSDPAMTVKFDKLAVETGVWPLKEAIAGEVRHTYIPRKTKPVEEYLKVQERFSHLFNPKRRDDIIQAIQRDVDRYWEEVRRREAPTP